MSDKYTTTDGQWYTPEALKYERERAEKAPREKAQARAQRQVAGATVGGAAQRAGYDERRKGEREALHGSEAEKPGVEHRQQEAGYPREPHTGAHKRVGGGDERERPRAHYAPTPLFSALRVGASASSSR